MWRIVILPMLVLALLIGIAARAWRGRSLLAWAGIALALQAMLAVLALTMSVSESMALDEESWTVALTVLAPLAGAGLAAAALTLLPRR